MKEPIRILNFVPNMRAAGIETFIMNVYRNIDRSKVQFDFIVHNKRKEFYDDEIESLGGKIYRFTYKDDKNLFKYIKDLKEFFKNHKEYKIVHGHMQSMMPLYLYIAKKNGVPIRIAHSHNSSYEKTLKGFILHVFSRLSRYPSNVNMACSKNAGKYLFGKRNFEVVYNGVNVERFKFNSNIREKIRNEYDLNNKFVIGNVGRFELQKNHKFLIDVFYEFQKSVKNSILLLIGEGKLQEEIKKKVEKLNLTEKVIFLGVRRDMNEIYNCLDCFVLPSLYEGLPVVGVEAQINGLSCLFSDTVTDEIKILDSCKFLSIASIKEWIDEMKKIASNYSERKSKAIFDSYDIKNIANELQEKYIMYEKNIKN